MGALYKLQAKAWFSNPFNKTEFITTSLFLVVLTAITSSKCGGIPEAISAANAAVIGSISVMMIMNGAMYSFGFAFFEMKESVLFKRIGATKISKTEAIGSFVLWGLTTTAITIAWISILIFFGTIAGPSFSGGILYLDPNMLAHADWAAVFSGMLMTAVAYLPIALFFVSISKNSEMYNIATTFYFFFFGFLGGSFTPNAGREWMDIIGYLSPMGWTRQLVMNGLLTGYSNIPLINPDFSWISNSDWTQIGLVDLALPVIFGGAAGLACLKTFKWD